MFNAIDQIREVKDNQLTIQQKQTFKQYVSKELAEMFDSFNDQQQIEMFEDYISTMDHIPEKERETYERMPSSRNAIYTNARVYQQLFEENGGSTPIKPTIDDAYQKGDYRTVREKTDEWRRMMDGSLSGMRDSWIQSHNNNPQNEDNQLELIDYDLDEFDAPPPPQPPNIEPYNVDEPSMEFDEDDVPPPPPPPDEEPFDVKQQKMDKKMERVQQKQERRNKHKEQFSINYKQNDPKQVYLEENMDPETLWKSRFGTWKQFAGNQLAERGKDSTWTNRYDFVNDHVNELHENMDSPDNWSGAFNDHNKRDYKRFLAMKNKVDQAFINKKFDNLNDKERTRMIGQIMSEHPYEIRDDNDRKDHNFGSPRDRKLDSMALRAYQEHLMQQSQGQHGRKEIVRRINQEAAHDILDTAYNSDGFMKDHNQKGLRTKQNKQREAKKAINDRYDKQRGVKVRKMWGIELEKNYDNIDM